MLECKDLIHLFSDYISGELDVSLKEQFENHLSKCPRCKVFAYTFRQTILLCSELQPVEVPPEVHQKLHIAIKQKWASRRTSFKIPASKGVEMKRKEVTKMAHRRHYPLAEFSRMESVFDRFLDRFFSDFFPRRWRGEWLPQMAWTPVVDLLDKQGHLLLRADLPGLKREDIKISVSDDNLLTISGETKQLREENRESFYRCERCYGAFSRTVQLPVGVIPEKVEATLKDGILEVKLPKKEVKKAKELEIEVK